jgi:hypothetical protein
VKPALWNTYVIGTPLKWQYLWLPITFGKLLPQELEHLLALDMEQASWLSGSDSQILMSGSKNQKSHPKNYITKAMTKGSLAESCGEF